MLLGQQNPSHQRGSIPCSIHVFFRYSDILIGKISMMTLHYIMQNDSADDLVLPPLGHSPYPKLHFHSLRLPHFDCPKVSRIVRLYCRRASFQGLHRSFCRLQYEIHTFRTGNEATVGVCGSTHNVPLLTLVQL